MRRMWTRHDLLRIAGVEITGEDTMRRMWSEDELIKINFLKNYNEALWLEYKDELNFSTMRKMYSEEMLIYHLTKKLIGLPERYIQTTTADFDESGDYIGNEEYIILPEDKTSGYQIVNLNVKGVATNGDYLTDMLSMFRSNNSLYLELDYLNTSKVTSMGGMFRDSQAMDLNLSSFHTSNVTDMGSMFFGSQATTLDLSSFDTSNVTDMGRMFQNTQATTLDLSSFDTGNVTFMNAMFRDSQATTLDLSSFDTSNVTDMGRTFENTQATTGYARTQADADKFNNYDVTLIPTTLVFEVK